MIASLVSTIIPVFNRPQQLQEAVASVLAQDYRPIEVIIVDDGSTDGETRRRGEALSAAHHAVELVRQSNAGPGVARESGRLRARGEFIQYLDSDDLLMPDKFSAQVDGLRSNSNAGISYCVTLEESVQDQSTRPSAGTAVARRALSPEVFRGRIWQTITPLYRRSVCDTIGPWSSARILEDWDYDCRAAVLGVELHYVGRPLAVHRHHVGERAGLAWTRDKGALRDRAIAFANAVGYAQRAGLSTDCAEFRQLVRSVFWAARESAAGGLVDEAKLLLGIAKAHSRDDALQAPLFELVASVIGWRAAGQLARMVASLRK